MNKREAIDKYVNYIILKDKDNINKLAIELYKLYLKHGFV